MDHIQYKDYIYSGVSLLSVRITLILGLTRQQQTNQGDLSAVAQPAGALALRRHRLSEHSGTLDDIFDIQSNSGLICDLAYLQSCKFNQDLQCGAFLYGCPVLEDCSR
eukprot:258981-Pleurochrysis_carterae.AAC.1